MNALKTLLIAATIATATVNAQIPTNGLTAHWSFNGHANDVSGNGHHGNESNVTSVAGKLGVSNTAYRFNSLNSFVSVPQSAGLDANQMSICAVVRPEVFYSGICQGNYIFSRGYCGNNGNPGMLYLIFSDNAYNDCNGNDTSLYRFSAQFSPIIIPGAAWQSNTSVHTGEWYCVVMTYDGTNCKVYVNGNLTVTAPGFAPAIGNSTDSVCIGKYPWGGANYPYNFNGIMDDVAYTIEL